MTQLFSENSHVKYIKWKSMYGFKNIYIKGICTCNDQADVLWAHVSIPVCIFYTSSCRTLSSADCPSCLRAAAEVHLFPDTQNNLFFLCVASCSTTTAAPVLDHRWSPEATKRKEKWIRSIFAINCSQLRVAANMAPQFLCLLFVPSCYMSTWVWVTHSVRTGTFRIAIL